MNFWVDPQGSLLLTAAKRGKCINKLLPPSFQFGEDAESGLKSDDIPLLFLALPKSSFAAAVLGSAF